jgi:hypothetical protein
MTPRIDAGGPDDRPGDGLSPCVCSTPRMVTRGVTQLYDDLLRPTGLHETWVASHDRKGSRIIGHRLAHVGKAKTVRVRKGQLLVTDGPFAETKEWIAGFDLLDCGNIDEAIEIASRHPMARFGRIEVRPLWTGD